MVSVVRPLIAAAFSGLIGAWVMPADAAKRQPAAQPVVERSGSGTIIQPTTTIVPDGTGGARVIVPLSERSTTGCAAGCRLAASAGITQAQMRPLNAAAISGRTTDTMSFLSRSHYSSLIC